jgi:two-component system, NarL family, sensor histidine kinase YdfH
MIEVGDDGIGFDPALAARHDGYYGLLGIRERGRLIGGQLTLVSAPGKDTRVQLQIPAREEYEERGRHD